MFEQIVKKWSLHDPAVWMSIDWAYPIFPTWVILNQILASILVFLQNIKPTVDTNIHTTTTKTLDEKVNVSSRHVDACMYQLITWTYAGVSLTGGFPSQKPVTRSFDVFFDLRLKN